MTMLKEAAKPDWQFDWTTPFDELTPEQLIARAEEMLPYLVANQADVEELNHPAPETHELFKKAGFYRTLVPKKYGGLEFDLTTFMRVTVALGRGCSNTAWCFALGSSHALQYATYCSEELQEEFFADPNFIAPGIAKAHGKGRLLPNGDLEVDGVFPFMSGCPYSSSCWAPVLMEDGVTEQVITAPRKYWTRLDDWGSTLGMKGSGSHSIRFDKAVIPKKYLIDYKHVFGGITGTRPGSLLHENPQYNGNGLSVARQIITAMGVCIATNAGDAFETEMDKTTLLPPIIPRKESPDFQRWYGEAWQKLLSAQTLLFAASDMWTEACQDQDSWAVEEQLIDARLRECYRLAFEACEQIVRVSGTSAIRQGQRIERVWRDMTTLHTHTGHVYFNEIGKTAFARQRFGLQ